MPKTRIRSEQMTSTRGLYRVWLQTRPGDPNPLVSIWIDPAMEGFERAELHGIERGERATSAVGEELERAQQVTEDSGDDEVPISSSDDAHRPIVTVF